MGLFPPPPADKAALEEGDLLTRASTATGW
jgi:hypothetical protein